MLPFASILMYLIVKIKDNENTKSNIIYGILIGIISIIGYKIRAIAIFILIAYIGTFDFTMLFGMIVIRYLLKVLIGFVSMLPVSIILKMKV